MRIIISEINNYNRNVEPQPPVGSKFMIEYFDSTFHNKITQLPSEIYPSLIDNGVMDLGEGTSYTFISDLEEVQTIINNLK